VRPRRSRHLRAIGICAAIAVGASLGVLAPAAVAAPPNDHFADRAPLTGPLPIEVSESNAGATAEEEELIGLRGFDSHHSLWWEWEAPATEVVSVSTCGSDFPTVLGVFTGDQFPPLWSTADFNPGGPECSSEIILPAVAGTVYDIGVDGESFYVPEQPRPAGEGTIQLRIAPLPPPPDDAFAAATPLADRIWEGPEGTRMVLGAASGYNWGATSEPGEPRIGGGASVWFSWTAPESGNAALSTSWDGSADKALAVYSGGALGSLTPVAASTEASDVVQFAAQAGREYRIAVDGVPTSGGMPWMGNFILTLSENLHGGPGYPVDPPPSSTSPVPAPAAPAPPTVQGHSVDSRTGSATFRFRSTTKGTKFRCAVDGKRYKACSSPFEAKGLKPGKHVFRVLAGAKGATSARPAVVHFTVPAPHRRHHAAG
jgi:hypothetical protein